jgi:FixJ family two-component response regulator
LFLDGHELSRGENIEINVFGSWIPGQVAVDAAGWYLVTLDQVGIRLQSGLPARSGEFRLFQQSSLSLLQKRTEHPEILLVDDDPALLEALQRMIALRLSSVHVETTNSSLEAVSYLQKRRFDAVVSDIKMPDMDGLELLARTQELQPETPTLLITGHGEHNLAIQALRGGAYDYIQKPIERDNFIAALLRAIQTCQLRRQVQKQQQDLAFYAHSLEQVVQQRTNELSEAHLVKDKVIGLVSHEMQDPITRLKDIIHLLQQKLGGSMHVPEIVNQSFAEIEQSIHRTEELLHELLTTSHLETQKFILHRQPCDLVALCQQIFSDAFSDVELTITQQDLTNPVEVEVDESQLRQVFFMLFNNTREMANAGQVVTITLQRTAREAIITMRDTGTRTNFGADFFISRKIVERHGGHLEIQYFPHEKRTVFISLPLLLSKALAENEAKISSSPKVHTVWTIKLH